MCREWFLYQGLQGDWWFCSSIPSANIFGLYADKGQGRRNGGCGFEKGAEVTKALGKLCAAILGVDTIIENCPGIKSTYKKVKKKLGK